MTRALVAACLLILAGGAAQAQSATPDAQLRHCFRGRPKPDCQSFWITEASYSIRLSRDDPDTYGGGDRYLATLEVGQMWNVGDRFAIGGGLGAGLADGVYFTLKPRLRYWTSRDVALDASPILKVTGASQVPRAGGEVALIYQDKVGIFAQGAVRTLNVIPQNDNTPYEFRKRFDLNLGVRLASKLGIGGAVADAAALLGVVVVYLIACSNNGCD